MLIDNHNRVINYLRLAVTDRCNLRCNYCMPSEGIDFSGSNELLSISELIRTSEMMVREGIDKIRITGGEPFVRKDLPLLLKSLSKNKDLKEISITTNGTLIGRHLPLLKELRIDHINLSMDAIEAETFNKITRRETFATVYENLLRMLDMGFKVKINCIVLDGQNIDQIYPMLELTRNYDVSVRFLEEMPFNGGSRQFDTIRWNYKEILSYISQAYPEYERLPAPATSTAMNYGIPGFKGSFGIIPSFSRTFCGSCNRLRISATGDLITCLYGKPRINIRQLLRDGSDDQSIAGHIRGALHTRSKTGFEEQQRYKGVFDNSMTSIGG
ncbi:GTP 3',8-cyclase MoaA [Robertkochia aurantiaca]|uniref:GTP 3',8-cyclase MoaA n=1 Tax=Robertkochia aurantiaca TaxID=2873700 RepID=UPI001CCC64A3|nr:GTP 3',8-cyclase MoaA [Robertkochia sp. 3YJGBD-33]